MNTALYENTELDDLVKMFHDEDERLEGASLGDILQYHRDHYVIPLEKRPAITLLHMQVKDLDDIRPLKALLSKSHPMVYKRYTDLIKQIPEELFELALPYEKGEVHVHNLKVNLGKHLGIEAYKGLKAKEVIPECTAQVRELKDKVWYRGMSDFPLHDVTKGTSDSAVFITDDPIQALSYAGENGYIAEIRITDDFFIQQHKPTCGNDFSPFTFHDEAIRIFKKNAVVFADKVMDSGRFEIKNFGDDVASNYTTSTNLALHSNNTILKAVSLKPAMEVLKNHMDALNTPKLESSRPKCSV